MEQNLQYLFNFKTKVDKAYLALQSSQYSKEKAFISKCFRVALENQYDKVKLRLHLIDSLYSTQMSKRYYGIEELAEALAQYSDKELIYEANKYVNKKNSEILKTLFTEKYKSFFEKSSFVRAKNAILSQRTKMGEMHLAK